MRLPDRGETREARADGGEHRPRPGGRRQSATRPHPRTTEGEGTRLPGCATQRAGSGGDRPRDEDGGERGVRLGSPILCGKAREAGADRDPPREGALEPQRRYPDRRGAGDGGDGVRPRGLDGGHLRGLAGLHGEAGAEVQGRVNASTHPGELPDHFAMTPRFVRSAIWRVVYPMDRKIESVSWPFFGTRAGFRVVVAACFAGCAITWTFRRPGMSTAGSRPRAFT